MFAEAARDTFQQITADTQETIEAAPDFTALGITDPGLIREELRRGPSISFYIGPQLTHFTLPVRMVIYSAKRLTDQLKSQGSKTYLTFPEYDPMAFAKVQTWFHEGTFGPDVLGECTANSPDLSTGIKEACALFCNVIFLARELDVIDIEIEAIYRLDIAVNLARTMCYPFPIPPSLVKEAWRQSEEPTALQGLLAASISADVLRGVFDVQLYRECLETCPGLVDIMPKQNVADRIIAAWCQMNKDEVREGKEDMGVLDAGRKSGWYKGPF